MTEGPLDDLPTDKLFELLGAGLRTVAKECLDEALLHHGGLATVVDGEAHDMRELINPDKLQLVLADARRRASERGLPAGSIDPATVITDDDALRYVQGAKE